MISDALSPLLKNEKVDVVNLYSDLPTNHDYDNVNKVKVVLDKQKFALNFSHEPIPSRW
jgi:3-deoxy-manno-octulosonate cytidylyltransferase (CMP-KDO synthetase)